MNFLQAPTFVGLGVVCLTWWCVRESAAPKLRNTTLAVYPWIFCLMVAGGWSVLRYRFVSNDLLVIFLQAFGFGFALTAIRLGSFFWRVYGGIFATIFGWMNFTLLYFWLFGYLGLPDDWYPLACLVFLLGWLPVMTLLLHRSKTAYLQQFYLLCPQCGYDLRGSIGRPACPECGEAIPPLPAMPSTL